MGTDVFKPTFELRSCGYFISEDFLDRTYVFGTYDHAGDEEILAIDLDGEDAITRFQAALANVKATRAQANRPRRRIEPSSPMGRSSKRAQAR